MRVSERWLREWTDPQVDSETLAQQLTMAGLEVDGVEAVSGQFERVIVGEVVEVKAHPDATKLSVCQVNAGDDGPLQIVCGASNVRPQLKVAVALVGAVLPNGLKIKKAKLRGVASSGMLCSSSELGLEEASDGIMELPSDAPVGEDLRQYLSLDDKSIEIDLTPNRGDCLSVVGIAREVSVLNRCDLKPFALNRVAPQIDDVLDVNLDAPEACGQYLGRVIKGVDAARETPIWIKERLRRCGLRSISLVVDITNYVMLEFGQPMHAFDLDSIDGPIVVRYAKSGERLQLLDEQEAALKENTLVIGDQKNVLAMAGIMGGLDSAVQTSSQNIFLESAFFAPQYMAGKARQYGLSTDSSHRFERGVDPKLQSLAIEQATQMIIELAGGQAGPITQAQSEANLPTMQWVKLRPQRARKLLGIDIAESKMLDCLTRLGMEVFAQGDTWEVHIPMYRFDISQEADLIEEIARVYGYNNIPRQATQAAFQAVSKPETQRSQESLSQVLVERGYHETISYSFVDPRLQQALFPEVKALDLLNPISSELSQMRVSLWPGLIASMLHNQHRQVQNLRLFEWGLRFHQGQDDIIQTKTLSGLICGQNHAGQWSAPTRKLDFYDLKGDVEALLQTPLQSECYRFVPKAHPALHPGQSAEIMLDGQAVGHLGTLHPGVVESLDAIGPVFLFEIDFEALSKARLPHYKAFSKFPAIRRDLSFIVDESIASQDIVTAIRDQGGEILQDVQIFDVYRGEGIEPGKKSMAIGLILQDTSRTLVDAEVISFMDAILNKLKGQFAINLRE